MKQSKTGNQKRNQQVIFSLAVSKATAQEIFVENGQKS